MALVGVLIVAWFIYIIPSIIAFGRKHPNRWLILVVNVVFGATGLGWLGSLVWACSALHLDPTASNGAASSDDLFAEDAAPAQSDSSTANDQNARTTQTDPIERLTQLQALRDSGALDDNEFMALKRKLLG